MKADSDQADKWRSVLMHDAHADGSFVYAVRTTGIYCRPSCPSRRPKLQSVEFYAAPAAAERAGFRACLRCKPHQPDPRHIAVLAACNFLAAHCDERVTLKALGNQVGMSPFHLQRLFSAIVGVSPRAYQEAQRLTRFKRSVAGGRAVTHAMLDSGFGSSSRLYEKSARIGMTPGHYRKHGAGAEISFTVFDTALGKVLLAATARGICKVSLGTSAAQLETELRTEFSAAVVKRSPRGLRQYVNKIIGLINGHDTGVDLPLDVRATAFQSKVWEILKSIPSGKTLSYSDIARRSGKPTAVRAAARAIASNPVALLIPCHRVIGKSGNLAGYRWGIERKSALLDLEKARAATLKKT